MKWLNSLLETAKGELGNPDYAPKAETKDYQKLIGVVPEDIRILYVASNILLAKVRAMVAEHDKEHENGSHDPALCQKLQRDVLKLKEDSDLLMSIFWRELREDIGTEHEAIGVFKDWKCASWAAKDDPDYRRSLLGGLNIEVIDDLVDADGSLADAIFGREGSLAGVIFGSGRRGW